MRSISTQSPSARRRPTPALITFARWVATTTTTSSRTSCPRYRRSLGYRRIIHSSSLTGKTRAAGVTGNIGECVAAIVARRLWGLSVKDVMHIRSRQPFRKRKAPDYLMRMTGHVGPSFGTLMPGHDWSAMPDLWPVESKARSTSRGALTASRDALVQIATYWQLLAARNPRSVGYGLIVTFAYSPTREVRVHVIVPKQQAKLAAWLQSQPLIENAVDLRPYVHEC